MSMDNGAAELARLLLDKTDRPLEVNLVMGVVSEIEVGGTIAVYLQGGTFPFGNVKVFNHYDPHVGDPVFLLKNGPDLMALGSIGSPRVHEDLALDRVPIGGILPWPGSTGTAPTNYLPCQGGVYNMVDYPTLGAICGATHGGDGSTTFAVPDLRGRVIVGAGTGSGLSARTLGAKFGSETHTLVEAEIPDHTHTISDLIVTGSAVNNPGSRLGSFGSPPSMYPGNGGTGYAFWERTQGASGSAGNGAHNNVQPSIALNGIIRAL